MVAQRQQFILLVIGLIPLFVAYIAEYFYNLAPCKLCLYQRVPYIAISFLTVLSFMLPLGKFFFTMCELLLLVGFCMSIFHFGVEKNFFQFSTACANNLQTAQNFEAFKAMLVQQDYVLCDQVSFKIVGVPISLINAIYSIFFFLLIIKLGKNIRQEDAQK
ncbi:disulfide bond formation protein B [Candidatus Bandiella euplotis]|uniref:Disulfide bond formation protein B n=1 Tax=Candidatus Bandiella euplotis TaxID=1664265 RepID=A0ABZ0UM17_9RICK|nr:disulfide bond formation protein B [Candidatus Bandiella woodruffii]WPX95969.1 Disulfide bond formation protein B [Candidatus Bandiella woodruffii]